MPIRIVTIKKNGNKVVQESSQENDQIISGNNVVAIPT